MGGQLTLWSMTDDHNTLADTTIPATLRGGQPVRRVSPRVAKRLLIGADCVALAAGVLLTAFVQQVVKPVPAYVVFRHMMLVGLSLPAFALGAAVNRLYQARANERPAQELANVIRAVATGVVAIVAISFAAQYDDLSRLWVGLLAITLTVTIGVERWYARGVFAKLRKAGRINRKIVIVGTDAHAINMMHTYQRDSALGYEIVGFVGDDDIGPRGGVEVLGTIAQLPEILVETDAVGVVLSLASVGQDDVNALTRRLTDDGYHVALSSILRDIDVTRLRPQQLDGRTLIYVEPVIRGGWRAVAKRAFDIVGAIAVLIVTLPIWLGAMVAIRVDSKGPVFFRQVRVGRNREPFVMTKLRTMGVDAEQRKAELMAQNEADGPLFKIANDPRITRVGRWLRKLSIDELPQLIAVLRGTMSLVGPRPALPSEVEEWDEGLRDRLRVPPGLTGLWQVSGRSSAGFEAYRRLDLYYVDNWSLLHDLRICLRTVGVVVRGRGAS